MEIVLHAIVFADKAIEENNGKKIGSRLLHVGQQDWIPSKIGLGGKGP